MSAILQVYTSVSCDAASELTLAGADYDLTLGPTTGLDGDTGDRADSQLFIKNTGNKPALSTQVIKDGDAEGRIEIRTGGTNYTTGILSLGDIMPAQVIPIYVRVTVPRGTEATIVSPNFTMKYRSLP